MRGMTESTEKAHELITPCVTRMIEELDALLQMNLGISLSKDATRILVCLNTALVTSECLPAKE